MYLHIMNSLSCLHILLILVSYAVSKDHLDFEPKGYGTNFNFTDCGHPKAPLHFKSLYFHPDPIRFGEILYLAFDANLSRNIGETGTKLEVDISFRIETKDGFMELCDIFGEHACHYNDFCAALDAYMERKKIACPPLIPKHYHNNCSCPFKQGEYNVTLIPVAMPKLEFGVRGTFAMTINILEDGFPISCFELQFCITDCNPLGTSMSTGEEQATNDAFDGKREETQH